MTKDITATLNHLNALITSIPRPPTIEEDRGAVYLASLTTPDGKVVSAKFNYDGNTGFPDVLDELGTQVGMKGVEITRASLDYHMDPDNYRDLMEYTTPDKLSLGPDRIVIDGELLRCYEYVSESGNVVKGTGRFGWTTPKGYQFVLVKLSNWQSPGYIGMVESKATQYGNALRAHQKKIDDITDTLFGHIAASMKTHS